MAIREFSVGPLRGLVHAEAHNLGNLVVLAGANGAGKSSLLDLLRARRQQLAEPGTEVMWVGPHRTWRSSALNKVTTYSVAQSYGELLQNDSLPQFRHFIPPGLQGLQGAGRQSGGADDIQAFVKTSIVRLRDRQQGLVTTAWESQGGRVESGSVPDLFGPFRRLIGTLLPHLEWVGVEETSPEDIQCLFRPTGIANELKFDIDELSSGEKAAVALLLPIVERQAEQLISPTVVAPGVVPLTMLLDEPEIHLHPLLQLQVLQFLRDLAAENTAQFIISTQSPTLLDALNDDELYLVSPASLSPDNQLSRLTTSRERLEVAREITGSTHLLTRAKPIVFLEGENQRSGVSSDAHIVGQLFPITKSWALVPGRAKRDVIESVKRLRQEGLDLPGAPVFGLVDADTDELTGDDHVVAWPVATIENLLLDAHAIYEALRPFGTQTTASNLAGVRAAMESVTAQRHEEEVGLRVQRQLPIGRLELRRDRLGEAERVAEEQVQEWLERLRNLDVSALTERALEDVQTVRTAGTELERFHGKRILHSLYTALHVERAGLSKPAFSLAIAAEPAARERASRLAGSAFDRIRYYFPAGLAEAVVETEAGVAAEVLAERCSRHYAAWLSGVPDAEDRAQFREEVFALARAINGGHRQKLVTLASEIGTT